MKHKISIDVEVSRCWEVECVELDDKTTELLRDGKIDFFGIWGDIEVYCSSCYPIVVQDGKEINVEETADMYKLETLSLAEWCKREHLVSEDYSGNALVRVSDADNSGEWWTEEDMGQESIEDNVIETDEEFDPGKLKIVGTRVYVGDDYFEILDGVEYDGKLFYGGGNTNGTNGIEVECVVNAETGEIVVRRC